MANQYKEEIAARKAELKRRMKDMLEAAQKKMTATSKLYEKHGVLPYDFDCDTGLIALNNLKVLSFELHVLENVDREITLKKQKANHDRNKSKSS